MVSDGFSEVFSQLKSDIAKLVFCTYHHLITLFITTFIADFGLVHFLLRNFNPLIGKMERDTLFSSTFATPLLRVCAVASTTNRDVLE